jgi:hypothetical protein
MLIDYDLLTMPATEISIRNKQMLTEKENIEMNIKKMPVNKNLLISKALLIII